MKSLAAWRRSAKYIQVGADRIAYWSSTDDDAQPTLLLIHGYPTSSWDWTGLWPDLKKHFRLIALDMLGFGLSDKPRNITFSIHDQADLQEALLAQLGVGDAHVFTHDYGNTVGQELLARQNEKSLSFSIRSMCFLNGGLFPEQHRARRSQKLGLTPLGPLLGMLMSEARLRTAFDEIYGPETKASDKEIAGHWSLIKENDGRRVLHKLLSYIPERKKYRDRWVGALTRTHVPMRLINGGADPVSGEHLYRHYIEHVPNADAVLFERIGHYPHTEAPGDVLAAFRDFHSTLSTNGAAQGAGERT
ncbi:MAG: alpha/beta hydrolase [Pseudomonadota bacterium]